MVISYQVVIIESWCIGAGLSRFSSAVPVDTTLVGEFFFSVAGGGKAPLPANRGTNPARNGDNCKIEPSISGIEASEQFSARAIETPWVQNLCV